ncbi:hypothetical protein [Brevibacillus daliensis]|uniref:hypothetical protein n=1 Tax=Brevibacillus daliensis TaxID=2892995 RepID=UPI0035A06A04
MTVGVHCSSLSRVKSSAVPTETTEFNEDQLLFSDYLLDWLEMMKHSIELITFISYTNAIKQRIVPYFNEWIISLKNLPPKHIQDFYRYQLQERGIKANTVIHYHANI